MTERFQEIPVGELFEAKSGKPLFVRDYLDKHPGPHPVYSASVTKPFGTTDKHDYDGEFLTWVMNGYGGRMQVIRGRFSATRDRGVLVPRPSTTPPDLNYLKFVMEPKLTVAAVGRRVDGRLNEYTKIYPPEVMEETIPLLTGPRGFDYPGMAAIGAKVQRIEAAQKRVMESRRTLAEAVFAQPEPGPTSRVVSLGDATLFDLSIGKRVTRNEHTAEGRFPVYSANVRTPFGRIDQTNLSDFSRASLLWGIDGIFNWNVIDPGAAFATTDHCGRLLVLDDTIDPEFVYWSLQLTRSRYGFDRAYRANLDNIANEVTVTIPTGAGGSFSLDLQRRAARAIRVQEQARVAALVSIEAVLGARLAPEAVIPT